MVAKKLDRRLANLGAKEIIARGLGDDQHPWGYEAALDPWLQNFWAIFRPSLQLSVPAQQVSNFIYLCIFHAQKTLKKSSALKSEKLIYASWFIQRKYYYAWKPVP